MPVVQAIQSFEHNGSRSVGQRFNVSASVADQLFKRGLVVSLGGAHPQKAGGGMSSASPAARVSQQTTSTASKRGGKRRRRGVE